VPACLLPAARHQPPTACKGRHVLLSLVSRRPCCRFSRLHAWCLHRFKITTEGVFAPANYMVRYNTSGGVSVAQCSGWLDSLPCPNVAAAAWPLCTNAFAQRPVTMQVHPKQCTAKPGEWQLVPFTATYDGYLCRE